MNTAFTSRFDPLQELDQAIDRRADPILQPRLRACAGELVRLVDCADGSSGRPSAHGVRRIIARSCVRSGQTPGLDVSWERIEDHVRMIVGELAAIRRKKRRIGRWSDLPVTPLMFG